MHITNIGGSLTTAVCLSLIAWSIRVLRAQKLAEQKSRENKGGARGDGSLPSIRAGRGAYARLSPSAFWLLVESRSVRPVLVDVRESPEEDAPDLELSGRLRMARVPAGELARALRSRQTHWLERTGFEPPTKRSSIVFVSTHGHSASQAAAVAVQLGFTRCAVIEGGLAAAAPLAPPLGADASDRSAIEARTRDDAEDGVDGIRPIDANDENRRVASPSASPSSPGGAVPEDDAISRDALATLVEYGAARGAPLVTVIDVRRYDERALYGSIRGSVHLPAEALPRALLCAPEEWARAFHFRKPGAEDLVVVYGRGNARAAYAKRVFGDAGMHRVLVLAGGVCGWREGGGRGRTRARTTRTPKAKRLPSRGRPSRRRLWTGAPPRRSSCARTCSRRDEGDATVVVCDDRTHMARGTNDRGTRVCVPSRCSASGSTRAVHGPHPKNVIRSTC